MFIPHWIYHAVEDRHNLGPTVRVQMAMVAALNAR